MDAVEEHRQEMGGGPSSPRLLQQVSIGNWRDVERLALYCCGYLVTALLPHSLDSWAVQRIQDVNVKLRKGWIRETTRRMKSVLGPFRKGLDFHQLACMYSQMVVEERWGRLRALHRGGWIVATEVDGVDELQRALDGGQGAILWGMSFCGTLVAKIALRRAGISLCHLSDAKHGAPLPPTHLGLRVIAPIHCIPENRFLSERVIIPLDGSLGYIRRLTDRLAAKGCIWVSGEHMAKRQNATTLLFGRQTRFATGAPSLAWKQRSPLLPVHVFREGHFCYHVVIQKPIDADRSRGKRMFVESAVRQFGERLQSCVLNNPADWSWHHHTVGQLMQGE